MIYIEYRKCDKCKEDKQVQAFIGFRSVCRVCYIYLSDEEKKDQIAYARGARVYYNNKTAWEKELLLRSNIEVLEKHG